MPAARLAVSIVNVHCIKTWCELSVKYDYNPLYNGAKLYLLDMVNGFQCFLLAFLLDKSTERTYRNTLLFLFVSFLPQSFHGSQATKPVLAYMFFWP